MMKTNDSKDKKFRQLSDEELEKVNGGLFLDGHSDHVCLFSIDGCPVGEIYKYVDGKCQCVPTPNTDYRYR